MNHLVRARLFLLMLGMICICSAEVVAQTDLPKEQTSTDNNTTVPSGADSGDSESISEEEYNKQASEKKDDSQAISEEEYNKQSPTNTTDSSASPDSEPSGNLWVDELKKNAIALILLGLLLVVLFWFIAERSRALRINNYAPRKLHSQIDVLANQKQTDKLRRVVQSDETILGKGVKFIVANMDQPYSEVNKVVTEIANREMQIQMARTSPLAVVAALAPIVGLLGSVIGIIEASNAGGWTTEIFISRALIPIGGGLIVTIFALTAYHYFKLKTNNVKHQLAADLQGLALKLLLNDPLETHEPEEKKSGTSLSPDGTRIEIDEPGS